MAQKTWTLNLRFFAAMIFVVGAGVIGAYYLRDYQLRANATAFLERAKEQTLDKDYRAAAKSLFHYLEIVPTDAGARVQLAETYDSSATRPTEKLRATELYFQALALAPDRTDLRVRLSRLLLEVRRPDTALEQVNKVLSIEEWENDPLGLFVKAVAVHELVRRDKPNVTLTEAANALREAIQRNRGGKDHVELANRLADVYRVERQRLYTVVSGERKLLTQAERDKLADEVMDQLVADGQESFLAYFYRFQYRTKHGLPGADEDLNEALKWEPPGSSSGLLATAGRSLQAGALKEAMAHFRKMKSEFPLDRRGYLGLANCHVMQFMQNEDEKGLEEAIKVLRDGLARVDTYDFALNLRLGQMLIRSKEFEEVEKVLSVLSAAQDERILLVSGPQRARMQAEVDLLRAGKFAAEGNYSLVEGLVQRALLREQTAGGTPEATPIEDELSTHIAQRAYSLLGTALGALGKWDRAAEALDKAIDISPQRVQLRLDSGQAWESAGRLDLAIAHYRHCVDMGDADGSARLALARALLRRQLMLPQANRDWQPMQDVLDQAPKSVADSFSFKLFAAQSAATQRKVAEAVKFLQEAEAAQPESLSNWRTVIFMYQQLRRPKLADQAMRSYSRLAKDEDKEKPLLVRAGLLTLRRQFGRAEQELSAALPALDADQQATVHLALARLNWRQGKRDAARTHLEKSLQARPSDIEALRQLCPLALATNRFDDLQRWEQRFRELEGPSGTEWRVFRAQRLIAQAEGSDDRRLAEAEKLQIEIERLRPTWSTSFRLKGMLCNKQGRPQEARAAYERAIELDRTGAFRRWDTAQLVQLIYPDDPEQGAQPEVDRLPESLASSREGSAMAIVRSISAGKIARAVEIAREAARQRPNDPVAQIWLGYTLRRADDLVEAEKAFLLAAELAPESRQTWFELLRFYVGTKELDKAREALTRLAESSGMPELQQLWLLVQGYQMVGDRAAAESHFDRLLQTHGEDADVLLQAGGFFSSTDIDRAEGYLRKAVQLQPENRQMYRALASLLARRGTEASFQEACKTLSGTADGIPVDPADQRLLSQLLLRHGDSEDRQRAIDLLEELVKIDAMASAEDRRTLAQVYEADGKVTDAVKQIEFLANPTDGSSARPEHLAIYADLLIRNLEVDKAGFTPKVEEAIKRLEELQPSAVRTLALRARWMAELGRTSDMERLIDSFVNQGMLQAGDATAKARLLASVAAIYDTVDRKDLAEKMFRQAAASDDPSARLSLAVFLAGKATEEDTDEAVSLCIGVAQSDSTPLAAIALSTVLTTGIPSQQSISAAEPILSRAVEEHAQDASLLLAMGSYRQMQGQTDEADELFRRTLAMSPSNVMAMNNLAFLLAQVGRSAEAMVYINRAIGIVGTEPGLLDTHGVVFLSQQQTTEAIKVFKKLAEQPTVDPRVNLHLALAYRMAGQTLEARDALERARAAGLQLHTLTPQDRQQLAELDAFLGGAPAPNDSP